MTAPPVDAYGVRHRRGCACPGWVGGRGVVAGVTIARCVGCDVPRIVRPRERKPA